MKLGISACMCAMTLLAAGVRAAYIWVPTDQPTIQAGIDAAIDGDTVMVLAGTYSGSGNRDIDFKGKKIWVYGFGGQDHTIIDCGGSSTEHHGGFIFRTGEDSTCLLTGFTIKNAWYPLPSSDSGAISIGETSAPVISFCTIANNHAHGVSVYHYGQPSLFRLQISNNGGWGVWMPGYPSYSYGISIRECQIDHNVLGGVNLTLAIGPRPNVVASNTIAENGDAGLYLDGEPPLSGVAAIDTSTTIERNVIAFNAGYGIVRGCCWFPGLHYYRNDVYGNQAGNWTYLGTADSICMLSLDPLFCRQASSQPYSLAGNSPCLAANNLCGADIGAFGRECTGCCTGLRGNVDCDPYYGVDISDLSRLIDFLYISFERLCCEEAANVDGAGSVDISDLTMLIDFLYISLDPLGNCP